LYREEEPVSCAADRDVCDTLLFGVLPAGLRKAA